MDNSSLILLCAASSIVSPKKNLTCTKLPCIEEIVHLKGHDFSHAKKLSIAST